MKRLGRAHEDVVATVRGIKAESRGHLLEIADHVIRLFLRSAVVQLRCAFNVDAVFVGPGEKESLDSLLSLMTRDRVSHNHRVQVAQMRETVGVVDGRGDVEGGHRTFWFSAPTNSAMHRSDSDKWIG